MDESAGYISALIGASSALVIVLIRDVVLKEIERHRQKKEERQNTYERYAQPLSQSAETLFWRLHEMLETQRSEYLLSNAPDTGFNRYKFQSTCYRLASLIGWIRAIRLEQSHLLYSEETSVGEIRRAVESFESALADGPHVEIHVLKKLLTLWSIDVEKDERVFSRVAARLQAQVQTFIFNEGMKEFSDLHSLSEDKRRELVQRVANYLTTEIQIQPLANNIINETCERAIKLMAVKQAFIYRDWQNAIGDQIVRRITDSARRYEVVGYAEYEKLVDEKNHWLERIDSLFRGVDVLKTDPSDFRRDQLRNVFVALARLLVAIDSLKFGRKILGSKTLQVARALAR